MKLNYLLLDVFTTEPLKGNPLAVVLKADGLLDNQMQAIAAEFNLSETVFIHKAQSERHSAAVRIFTPLVELPFAGHPTVGAAVVLGLQNRSTAVRLEEKVGVITCVIERVDKETGLARFALPKLPEEVGKAPARQAIATTLGLEPEEIGCGPYEPALFSAGVPFYLIPVRDAGALKRIRLERRGWEEVYPVGHRSIYVFTQTPEERGNEFAARMFSPGMGLGEDPATGSAAAALIGLIARQTGNGQHEFRLRQGHEMGRPSLITLQLRKADDQLTHGGIGGHAVIVGEGVLNLGG
ncbi:MAG: phenazine biosynthesis protein PhzF [Devosia sp.]|uniref:PhzF family phenazine biosynthesis protein n=1 Tax=Devosia sp. TaxID=1871048 RepID=UPI0026236850|nr:PhzF family phenazine biosynthesis protein [Devosia sp.]MDB5542219.1 phenazine biosynthesis protein PhzF [Devosia sp.]